MDSVVSASNNSGSQSPSMTDASPVQRALAWVRNNRAPGGGILVHHLGASQRWRIGFESQGTDEGPEPELEPLPTIDELRERWEAEWAAVDAWLPTLTDDFIGYVHEGVPVWQMLVHVVNHGTQHRAEAAALLTAEGRSPGELDLINYAEEQADGGS